MINTELLLTQYLIELPKELVEKLIKYEKERDRDSIYEVIKENEMVGMLDFLFKEASFKGICPILADNNSNCIGYFYTGPLKGKICFIDHEETDLSPGFRSINNLIKEILRV